MKTTRSGSAILFCLALATIAVMVGFAFLRAATRQAMSGKSEMLTALARDAAQSGLSHATEQILTDYNAPSLEVVDYTGKFTKAAAPTFLDGPYRAPFVSFNNPNVLEYTQREVIAGDDDASEENHLLTANMTKREVSYNWWHYYDGSARGPAGENGGCQIYDARGRYIEVGYYNFSRPDPSVGSKPEPVPVIKFTDMGAVKPERFDGLFLDEKLHRLTSGTPEAQRQNARYRVRYAVGVEDLSGHLLMNPLGKMNTDWKNPNNDYRVQPLWLDHASYVYDNMVSCWAGGRSPSLRMEHIFRGRGNSGNADRAWVAGATPLAGQAG